MNGWLLDTNVVSELVRKRPDPRILERLRALPADRTCTSAICVMELRHGAARLPHGDRLWERLRVDVLGRLRVVPFGATDAMAAGDMLADLEQRGRSIGVEDVLIGATALARDLTVVTRNVSHFDRIRNLRVESWWD